MTNESQNIGKREQEVVRLLMQGKGNNQIAYELGISVRTVEYHLGRVYAKLNVASRVEAIVKLSNSDVWESTIQANSLPEKSQVENAEETGGEGREASSPHSIPPKNLTRRGWLNRFWAIAILLLAILTGLLSLGILIPSCGSVEPQIATVIVPRIIPQTRIVIVTQEVFISVPEIRVATVEVTRIVCETVIVTPSPPEPMRVDVPQVIRETAVATPVIRETPVVTPFPPEPLSIEVSQGVDLTLARTMHTATRLNDYRILLAGGSNGVDDQYALVEIFDPLSGTFTQAAPLNTGRHDHTATLLQDGRVLVVGGYNSRQSPMTDAEVYDPWTNTWTTLAPLYAHGVQHTATLLADGRVLVIGGCSAGCPGLAELFDPQTSSWSAAPALGSDAASHSALLLADGRVLVAGGTLTGSGALLYDPQANSWTPTGPMSSQHAQAAMVKLLDGRALIAGGINYLGAPIPLGSTEIYDPATNTWTVAANLSQPRYAHLLALLPDGQVVAVGGARIYEFSSAPSTADTYALAIELYDPRANRWVNAAELPLPITYAEIVTLPDGRLWVTGGGAGYDSAKAWANTWLIKLLTPGS